MTNELQQLAKLLTSNKVAEAPAVTRRAGTHYEAIIGIGKDHHACVTLTDDAYNELMRLAGDEDTAQSDTDLCRFYGVSGYPALVQALVDNVIQLQEASKRNVKPWEDTMPPTLLPAYIKKLEEANKAAQSLLNQEK